MFGSTQPSPPPINNYVSLNLQLGPSSLMGKKYNNFFLKKRTILILLFNFYISPWMETWHFIFQNLDGPYTTKIVTVKFCWILSSFERIR